MMRLIVRLIELVLLMLLVIIAAHNSQMVKFQLLFGYQFVFPLIVLLAGFFFLGIFAGLLIAANHFFVLRHQIMMLKRQHSQTQPHDPTANSGN